MRRRSALSWVVWALPIIACGDGGATADVGGTQEDAGTSGPTSTGPVTSGVTSVGTAEDTASGALPPTPQLVRPADGATDVPIETELCWNLVEDPDGDAVRYRVFIDDIELTQGVQGEMEGYEGPCVGPLTFVHEKTYAWQVEAFEVDDPNRSSDKSDTWTFTTLSDGDTRTVFEDKFDEDRGWEVTGDATGGAWVRGKPVMAVHQSLLSQPGRCDGGQSCYFTGQNPDALPADEDVAGGSTILTSPAFDLDGAVTATVELRRFFYKSQAVAGPDLRVELLVPDAGEPGGYAAHELETLQEATADAPDNVWTPREYAACGLPMVDGSRLRITASDTGTGILEAAIDTVVVRAHDLPTVCESGAGGMCDPSAGAGACPQDLLCCAQGMLNAGVYRCQPAVAGLDYDNPTASPEAPNNGPLGCDAPDLIIDPSWIEPVTTDIFATEQTCLFFEGCVGALGWRTVLRFALNTPNIGSRDLVLGVTANNPDVFHFSECHGHHHFDEYARYELLDQNGVVAEGHKQAFCLLDHFSWAWPNTPGTFDCANQGISRGFADTYESDLPCQWIDVTGLPPGDYTLRAVLNEKRPDAALPLLNERDYTNNTVEVSVTLE